MPIARMPRVAALVAALLGLLAVPAHAVTIDWVTVGDPGNAADTTGASDGSKYAVRSNMGDKPVNFVSWFDAARVANWLHNGGMNVVSTDATAGAPQNTSAYTLGTVTSGIAPAKNVEAQYWIPTENAANMSSSVGYTDAPSTGPNDYGFRLASPVAVPEPSTCAMALAGLACGGYTMFRRRKQA
jgi:hypothetical protein